MMSCRRCDRILLPLNIAGGRANKDVCRSVPRSRMHPIWAMIKYRDGNWDAEDCHDCWRTAAGLLNACGGLSLVAPMAGPGS